MVKKSLIYRLEYFGFRYPGSQSKALHDINLEVEEGDFVLLCGVSGSGKTTLLRHLKPSLAPHGTTEGKISFGFEESNPFVNASYVGFVQQNPENQIVTDKVWHELAFGLESLGLNNQEIRRRVAEMASFFGIEDWFYKNVSELSGGQMQLLNLASALVMQPKVLILDEPTGFLDPIAAADFFQTLLRINKEMGITIVMTEHRADEILAEATKIVVMEDGMMRMEGKATEVAMNLFMQNHPLCAAMPASFRVCAGVHRNTGEECIAENAGDLKEKLKKNCAEKTETIFPLTVRDGRRWLLEEINRKNVSGLLHKEEERVSDTDSEDIGENFDKGENIITTVCDTELVLNAERIWFKYTENDREIVRECSLGLKEGEILTLVGGNGAGKSTLLKIFAGINQPQRGTVSSRGRIAYMPQNPQLLFVKKTVAEDLADALKQSGGQKHFSCRQHEIQSKTERRDAVDGVVSLCGIEHLLDRHPYDLSGGEQHKVALAKILLPNPDVLLLDEPTKGLDASFKSEYIQILRQLQKNGSSILMVSHDMEFIAEISDRCAMVFDGGIVSEAPSCIFFSKNSFYTTTVARLTKGIVEDTVTVSDAVFKICSLLGFDNPCAEECQCDESQTTVLHSKATDKVEAKSEGLCIEQTEGYRMNGGRISGKNALKEGAGRRKISKKTLVTVAVSLLFIPLTLWVGSRFLHGKKYYFTSLMILFEIMLPFFFIYEGRKPKAREIIVVASLCAIAVAGRVAFFMLPQFKPVMAVSIVAGIVFGGETGFLVGAISMFASNLFFSQGAWTPWQMVAMGFSGLLSGIAFGKFRLPKHRIVTALFGFLTAVIIYGGIMNFSSAIMWSVDIKWENLVSYYVTGFPFDMIHGAATAIFLWVGSKTMIEKLERIKQKYGLVLRNENDMTIRKR